MNRKIIAPKICPTFYLKNVRSIFFRDGIRPGRNESYKIQSFLISIFFFLILINFTSYAQSDWAKWGKADYSYELPANNGERNYSFDNSKVGDIMLKSLADAYWIFISNVDGDNCSFNPTCSSFLLESVHQTNLFQGTIMFFDRFTRDMDIYKKYDHYPRVLDGHFYDPPSLYTLDENKIKYLPPSEIVNK